MGYIVMFFFGALAGITALMVWVCCRVSSETDRRYEEELRKHNANGQKEVSDTLADHSGRSKAKS